jgi:hypothetical protein
MAGVGSHAGEQAVGDGEVGQVVVAHLERLRPVSPDKLLSG